MSARPVRPDRSPLVWDMGVAMLSAYDADGFLEVQYDAEGENESGLFPYEAHSLGGMQHRPLDPVVDDNGLPDESQACTVLFATEGDKGHIFVLEDPRVIVNLPLLQKGETQVYAAAGQFILLGADGSITSVTTDDGGAPTGTTITDALTPDGCDLVAPWGRQSFDAHGWRVQTAGGGNFTIGYAGGLIPGLGSFISAQADMIELDAAAITIGPTGVPAMGVTQAIPLATALETVTAALTTIATAIGTAVCAAPGSPLVAAGLPSAISAIETAQTAIEGIPETCATQTALG